MRGGTAQETGIGIGVTALAIVAMVFDHLIGDEQGFPVDPPAFVIGAGLSLGLAVILFGVVVPRTRADPVSAERAAKRGFICSLLAVVALPAIWLGPPFILAGGGVALGLLGSDGKRKWLARAAILVGTIVVLVGIVGTDWGSET